MALVLAVSPCLALIVNSGMVSSVFLYFFVSLFESSPIFVLPGKEWEMIVRGFLPTKRPEVSVAISFLILFISLPGMRRSLLLGTKNALGGMHQIMRYAPLYMAVVSL